VYALLPATGLGLANGAGLPDLCALRVHTAGVRGDWQRLQITGSVVVVLANLSTDPVNPPFQVSVFEDRNGNARFDPAIDGLLGAIAVPSLPALSTNAVACAVSGSVRFRGNLVYAAVDSDDAVAESNEANNVTRSGLACAAQIPPAPLAPSLLWAWTNAATLPAALNVIMTPAVVDLEGNGVPDVVLGSTESVGSGYVEAGCLRALHGGTGLELWTVTNAAYRVNAVASVAAGDLDHDGRPEIVAGDESGSRLLVFEHDGAFKWRSPCSKPSTWARPPWPTWTRTARRKSSSGGRC